MAITLNDVAQRAGVSRSAVSRTFTDGASVSKVMRQKVEDAAIELGYTPNFLARSLTTRSTKLIGLVSDNFHNPIFLEVFDQFTRGLQDRGLRPLLVNLSETDQASSSLRMLQQYSVDGVIVASSTLSLEVSEAFRRAGIPVVNSFGRFSLTPKVDVVGIDDEAWYHRHRLSRNLAGARLQAAGFSWGPTTGHLDAIAVARFFSGTAARGRFSARHYFCRGVFF